MADVAEILQRIRGLAGCEVYAPERQPDVAPPHALPEDLRRFYSLCGGLSLFEGAEYPAFFSRPKELVPANPVIIGEQVDDDISASWYIIANDGSGEYLTIDLNPARLGRCYDSFSDRHGVAGSCPIIATSFTDLLERLVGNHGRHWYWLEPGFRSLGDAYDSLST